MIQEAINSVVGSATDVVAKVQHEKKAAEAEAKADARYEAGMKMKQEKLDLDKEKVAASKEVGLARVNDRAYKTAMSGVTEQYRSKVRHTEAQWRKGLINDKNYDKIMKQLNNQYSLDAAELEAKFINKEF